MNINKRRHTPEKAHSKHEEMVKLDKEAHQDTRKAKRETPVRNKARARWKLRHSP